MTFKWCREPVIVVSSVNIYVRMFECVVCVCLCQQIISSDSKDLMRTWLLSRTFCHWPHSQTAINFPTISYHLDDIWDGFVLTRKCETWNQIYWNARHVLMLSFCMCSTWLICLCAFEKKGFQVFNCELFLRI